MTFRDISIIVLGLAKIVKQVGSFRGKKPPTGSQHQILHDLLLGVNAENKHFIFGKIAMSSIPVLSKSDTQHLSNLAECIPNVNGGRTLFDISATICGISTLKTYPTLFGRMQLRGHQTRHISSQWIPIVALDNLSNFRPQAVSNIVRAYATAGKPHPRLFNKVANHVIAQGDLDSFLRPFPISFGRMQLQRSHTHNFSRKLPIM